ncbi:hypothetical protein QAD02_004088 [Eretmocerus hayati]|uniref:Uncharacterized protein n=1 Tax=Eretmocerus hayati TaxID=131215 RepID=A0ACC2NPS4_9HYME|nr:hypothetical protein QAD02_004088 [Eretmocerus hayati]
MSSLKERRSNHRGDGISTACNPAAARRYAAPGSSGGGVTGSRSFRSLIHGSAPGPGSPVSPLRSRSKYELRSISFEGSKVLPWTSRLVHLLQTSIHLKRICSYNNTS